MKIKNIMTAYIQKYKLVFPFLFLLAAGVLHGQTPQIESMVYTVYDPQYIFHCGKATSIDLYKVAHLYVSPDNGYWGDINGVPYNGKASIKDASIKERQYTDGSIFTPPVSVADTGMYNFYFYFTSAKDYCGIKTGTRFILNLYIGAYGCLEPVTGVLDRHHYFCYGQTLDMSQLGRHEFAPPITIANLLFTYSEDMLEWKKNRMLDGDWVDIDVYTDREHKPENKIGNGDMEVDLTPASGSYDTTFYVIIHQQQGQHGMLYDSINITVYPQSRLDIYYSPEIDKNPLVQYDIDQQITITVDTSQFKFIDYTFLLNNNNLNKYYFGGDVTKNQITLNALAFTGAEDFIQIIATDKNNCLVDTTRTVIVPVPFPTVFTPDGDGTNDVFLGGEKFRNREFHLEITNRWGNRLYSGESGWDGNYRGNKVPPGTYLYILLLKTSDGSTKTVTGTVTLIREDR
jgi:gliding motility-associated-like protein